MPNGLFDAQLKADFAAAGFDADSFTPEEQACISQKMHAMKDEAKPQDQKIAIAISTCAPSKAKARSSAAAGAATFEANPAPAQSAAAASPQIKIKGADYRWTDTKDGYFTVHDVHLMSEVPKGLQGAPKDWGKAELEESVRIAQERYHSGQFCATAFKGHNSNLPITSPDFYGYVLPNRVGLAKLEDEQGKMVEKWTIFGDVKMNKASFEKARRGEIPYHSPEYPWVKNRISGLAFLDTRPPHFEYPLFTLGEEVKESKAGQFAVTHDYARFMDDAEEGKKRDDKQLAGPGMGPAKGPSEPSHFCVHCDDIKSMRGEMERMGKYMSSNPKTPMEAHMADKPAAEPAKPTATPIEPGTPTKTAEPARMELDPKAAAQTASFEARIKQLEDEAKAKKDADVLKGRMDWAMAQLKGKVMGDSLPKTLATFASDEPKFKELVEELKKSLPAAPPGSMAEFQGAPVEPSEPSVAKFSQLGPVQGEKAAKFAAQYREMRRLGWAVQSTEEEYVKFHMSASA